MVRDPTAPENPEPALSATPGEASISRCPKCLRDVRAGSQSCPKCGLVFELWDRGIARVPGRSPGGEGGDPRAEELWTHIEAHPGDEAGHEAFLGYCQVSGQLDLAARRYQAFLLENPDSGPGAAFRDRIVLLAQLDRKPAPKPRRRPYRALKIMIAIGIAALIWIFFAARMTLLR